LPKNEIKDESLLIRLDILSDDHKK